MNNQLSLWDQPEPKKTGQRLALSKLEKIDPNYRFEFEQVVNQLCSLGKPFSVEDVISKIGLPSSGINKNNSVGAIMSALAAEGKIIAFGYTTAKRKESHGRILRSWMGKNATK
jgi:hypothetical protein